MERVSFQAFLDVLARKFARQHILLVLDGAPNRSRRTEARLQVMIADFRFAWSELLTKYGGIPADQQQRATLAALLRNFVIKVELVAETETGEWAQSFSQRIESFDGNPNLRMPFGHDDKGRDGRARAARRANSDRTPRRKPMVRGRANLTPRRVAARSGARRGRTHNGIRMPAQRGVLRAMAGPI